MQDELDERRDEAERLRAPSPVRPGAGGLRARAQRAAAGALAAAQQSFNDVVLRLFDALSARVDEANARTAKAEQRAAELEERLLRLERRPAAAAPATVAPQPRAGALPDYFAFESRLRGSTAEIRERQRPTLERAGGSGERQRPYVERLRAAAPVLDLGCGRGELLGLLRDAGVDARGVDANADMVAYAAAEGLDVMQSDAHSALAAAPDGSLGAVVALQLVEHLPPGDIVSLLELAHAKLRSGGVLVLETINPATPEALLNYFADLTHQQPLVPETLELLVRHAGFGGAETVYLTGGLDYAIVATAAG